MKRLIFLLLILSLTACSTAAVESTATPTSTPEPTATFGNFQTRMASAKNTQRAENTSTAGVHNKTATASALTPSLTPTNTPILTQRNILKSIPTQTPTSTTTSYPTFDPAGIQTRTPLSAAVCPPENPDLELSLDVSWETNPNDYDEIILDALNAGASLEQVSRAFDQAVNRSGSLSLLDLTGDNVSEMVIRELFYFLVIGCIAGKYTLLLDYDSDASNSSPRITTVQDMNLNGTPEVVLEYPATTGWNTVVDVLEWDGSQFVSIIRFNHGKGSTRTSRLAKGLYWFDPFFETSWNAWNLLGMNGGAEIKIQDLDRNGTKDLILKDNGPAHLDTLLNYGPWRGQEMTFTWDGIQFLYSDLEMDPPEYRFQAVQDADRLFLLGEYDRALQLYQDVIFSDKLEWWSPERIDYERDFYFYKNWGDPKPELPPENTDEYLNLSAYARYRFVLHHLAHRWFPEAETNYHSLLEKFPQEGLAGHGYVIMATLLWDEYQKTGDIALSCQPVVEFAAQHSELLRPLGSSEHGGQSHRYEPEDICPFQ